MRKANIYIYIYNIISYDCSYIIVVIITIMSRIINIRMTIICIIMNITLNFHMGRLRHHFAPRTRSTES